MSNNKNLSLSFIIPAYNEQRFIGEVLESIHSFHPDEYGYEMIIIDNGSTDQTVSIARDAGAKVIVNTELTIAGLRNLGVQHSTGDILVFIDADVVLSEAWKVQILDTIALLVADPLVVTGSRYLPTDKKTWLNLHWFKRMTEYEAPYINSGHLITSRHLFELIGGFNEELETAEDYDFCMRAKGCGAQLVDEKRLPAIHLGYPEKVSEFFTRERWHGRQDFMSLKSFLDSKIAWIAAFNLFAVLAAIIVFVFFLDYRALVSYFVVLALVSIALTIQKYKIFSPWGLLNTSAIFFLYIWGRSMSFVDRLKK